MRKPVFPRILLLFLFYCFVFTVLVSVQFTKQGGFTQKVRNFIVAGQYRQSGENDPPLAYNEYLLIGDAHVYFGGIDFGMIGGDEEDIFYLTGEDGIREEALPERMVIAGDSVRFIFGGGTELEFSTQYTGGALEMRITGEFPEGINGAYLPFKPLRKTVMRDAGDGRQIITADGANYSFGYSPMDEEFRALLIMADGETVSYRMILEQKDFSPEDFIIPQAQTEAEFTEALTRWRDQNFSLWNRTASEQNNEDLVIAYGTEALVRGTFRAAIASIPQSFLRGSSRTYESAAFLGNLDQAYQSLVTREREKISRLSRQLNEKSLEFLKEPHVFEYFAVRGQNNFFDEGADLVRTIDPAVLALDITPGILEGYLDWITYRPDADNPFTRLIDQACFVIAGSLKETTGESGRVFSFTDDRGDTEFNLRLGKGLLNYAESANNSQLSGLGRSLILSALSMSDAQGTVKEGLVIGNNGEISESPPLADLTTARLYRILNPAEIYPRAVAAGTTGGIWAWTAAQSITVDQKNDAMDFTVRFPAGETHYMILRGIRPFVRLRLYNMDFRSDPQFERYDSSGWVYYPQDQVLVLKMKHRTADELISIIFREEQRPAPAVQNQPETQDNTGAAEGTEES